MLIPSLLIAPARCRSAAPEASVPHAAPEPALPAVARSPAEWQTAVRDALAEEAAGADHQPAVGTLVALYKELAASYTLPPIQRRRLLAAVRTRLARVGRELAREQARLERPAEARQAAQSLNLPPEKQAILAQRQGNPLPPAPAVPAGAPRNFRPGFAGAGAAGPGGNLAAMTEENAEQLIELIQSTIAPASWDVNGGGGSIQYFSARQLLIIRQRGDLHDRIGGALRDLRGN